MKSKVLQAVVTVFVVMTLMPVLGRAQAEINPDHFDSPASVAKAGSEGAGTHNAASFYGSFNLPFRARCAGVNLPPGSYSLSVRRLGKKDVITLAAKANSVRVQAFGTGLTSRSSAEVPSALVVERTKQRRIIAAIRFGEPGMMLNLQAEKVAGSSGDTELVLIASSTGR
jgi:hypothetical protein